MNWKKKLFELMSYQVDHSFDKEEIIGIPLSSILNIRASETDGKKGKKKKRE